VITPSVVEVDVEVPCKVELICSPVVEEVAEVVVVDDDEPALPLALVILPDDPELVPLPTVLLLPPFDPVPLIEEEDVSAIEEDAAVGVEEEDDEVPATEEEVLVGSEVEVVDDDETAAPDVGA